MARIDKTVFISYRRTNAPWVLAISQNLTFNGYDVFFDYTGLASGDFETAILENIHSRAHFLVLLTLSALERCGDPGDWLRREIEAALDDKRNIVPLMLEGFDFGTPSISNQLTGKLAFLRKYNAMTLSAEYFEAAMEKLRSKFLKIALDTVVQPASPEASQTATGEKAAVAEAPQVAEEELTAQQWFERGFNATDVNEQIRLYSEAIRLKPEYAEAFYNRGWARGEKGDLDDALADYDKAIRLKPDYAKAFYNRGWARNKKGDVDGAFADYNEAIRLKPDYSKAIGNRGMLRKAKGDVDGAFADYNEAIRLEPSDPINIYNRGNARKAKGDLEGALTDYDEAIRLKSDFSDAIGNRGMLRKAKGDMDGALADYDEVIRLKPDAAVNFNNRGVAREAKGDLDGALADYDEAIRLKPDYTLAIKNRELLLKTIADRSKP